MKIFFAREEWKDDRASNSRFHATTTSREGRYDWCKIWVVGELEEIA